MKTMIKVKWELEEAVALFDVYFNNAGSLNVSEDILTHLTEMYIKRANIKGILIDYALVSPKLYEKSVYEVILNHVRLSRYTDHAAIALVCGFFAQSCKK